ncbi:MAG: hypothetical protein WCO89_12295 [Syntrophus sp. (in: bacteria)]
MDQWTAKDMMNGRLALPGPDDEDENIKEHFYYNKRGCTSPKSKKCGICGNEKKEGACTQIRESTLNH